MRSIFVALGVLLAFTSPAIAVLETLGNVRVGGTPQGLQLIDDIIYVALKEENTVARISSYLQTPNVTQFVVEGAPVDVVPSITQELGRLLIVSCYEAGYLAAIDLDNGYLRQRWVVGEGPTYFTPLPIANEHYISSEFSNHVTAFDISTLSLGRSYRTGSTPSPPEVGKRGRTAFIPNRGEDTVSILDLVNGLDTRIPLPSGANPRAAVLSADSELLLVTGSGLDHLYFINTTSQLIQFTLEEGIGPAPHAITLSPAGNYAFVTNYGSNTVSVVDVLLRQVVETVRAGIQPVSARVFAERLFVSNEAAGTVSVFQIQE